MSCNQISGAFVPQALRHPFAQVEDPRVYYLHLFINQIVFAHAMVFMLSGWWVGWK
jgi:hypothetical protein